MRALERRDFLKLGGVGFFTLLFGGLLRASGSASEADIEGPLVKFAETKDSPYGPQWALTGQPTPGSMRYVGYALDMQDGLAWDAKSSGGARTVVLYMDVTQPQVVKFQNMTHGEAYGAATTDRETFHRQLINDVIIPDATAGKHVWDVGDMSGLSAHDQQLIFACRTPAGSGVPACPLPGMTQGNA